MSHSIDTPCEAADSIQEESGGFWKSPEDPLRHEDTVAVDLLIQREWNEEYSAQEEWPLYYPID